MGRRTKRCRVNPSLPYLKPAKPPNLKLSLPQSESTPRAGGRRQRATPRLVNDHPGRAGLEHPRRAGVSARTLTRLPDNTSILKLRPRASRLHKQQHEDLCTRPLADCESNSVQERLSSAQAAARRPLHSTYVLQTVEFTELYTYRSFFSRFASQNSMSTKAEPFGRPI